MPSEDTLIVCAIDRATTPIKNFINVLGNFFELKANLDPTDRFNLVIFVEKVPAHLPDFTFQWQKIIQLLHSITDRISQPSFEGGLFMALTFILDIYKLVCGKYFRIILIKDKSVPEITKDFLVNDLLTKVRPMPVFLDVICLGMDSDPDELKILDMINSSQGGNLYYVRDIAELNSLLRDQAGIKKEIKVDLWEKGPDFKVKQEYKQFYEDLAADLVPVDDVRPEMKCSICFKETSPVCNTDALVKCPSCNTLYHDCCLVSWSEQSNIGIEHVFRCPICFYLIKLPEFLVNDILNGYTDSYTSFESFLQEVDQLSLLKERDEKAELDFILRELEI
ncbi:MAG: hypothetical protein ACTSWN_12275 [Promethearchaeota archaeon]